MDMTERIQKRSEEELLEASKALAYEFQMLWNTAMLLSSDKFNRPDDVEMLTVNFALLESFLIHARNLLDFLFTRGGNPDYVSAKDYVENWWEKKPKKSLLLTQTHGAIHTDVSHLSFKRNAVLKQSLDWRYLDITLELRERLSDFAKLVTEKSYSNNLETLIQNTAQHSKDDLSFYENTAVTTATHYAVSNIFNVGWKKQ